MSTTLGVCFAVGADGLEFRLRVTIRLRVEIGCRVEIGVHNLMWGADFPHVEGTWPRTRKSLARCFAGVPPDDVRAILSENPARLYGFDLGALQPAANRVGPTMKELAGAS